MPKGLRMDRLTADFDEEATQIATTRGTFKLQECPTRWFWNGNDVTPIKKHKNDTCRRQEHWLRLHAACQRAKRIDWLQADCWTNSGPCLPKKRLNAWWFWSLRPMPANADHIWIWAARIHERSRQQQPEPVSMMTAQTLLANQITSFSPSPTLNLIHARCLLALTPWCPHPHSRADNMLTSSSALIFVTTCRSLVCRMHSSNTHWKKFESIKRFCKKTVAV